MDSFDTWDGFPYSTDLMHRLRRRFMLEVLDWCDEQFGKESARWSWDVSPVSHNYRRFYFRDEKDMIWFTMRWL